MLPEMWLWLSCHCSSSTVPQIKVTVGGDSSTDPTGTSGRPRWHWFVKSSTERARADGSSCVVRISVIKCGHWTSAFQSRFDSGQAPEVEQPAALCLSSCRWCWTPTRWTSWAWSRRCRTPPGGAGCPLSSSEFEPAETPWHPSPVGAKRWLDLDVKTIFKLNKNWHIGDCHI